MTVTLDVTKRDKKTPKAADAMLGVVYGPKQESISLSLDKRTFEKTLKESGESTIITLKGLGEDIEVLVHDVAFNAEKGGVEHVDFYAIERGKELTTNVALEFIGEAPVEKSGATVNKVLHDVEVTCRPSVLPSHIEVDLSVLTEEMSQITVNDLVVAEGVTIGNDIEDVVVNVSAAREEEPEEVVAVDMDAVEVEAKGKGEEAGDAAAEEKKE
ncbi:MAG: large subunit ribosomal protein L25 [Candidatus Azotimanducaceae bacterium]|jgi:large subunit ribosomal protein L25